MDERPGPVLERGLHRLATSGETTSPTRVWADASTEAGVRIRRRRRRATVTLTALVIAFAAGAIAVGVTRPTSDTTAATDPSHSASTDGPAPSTSTTPGAANDGPLPVDELLAIAEDPDHATGSLVRLSATTPLSAGSSPPAIIPASATGGGSTPEADVAVQQPRLNHDRTEVAFVAARTASNDSTATTGTATTATIWVMDVDGSNPRPITEGSVQDATPVWSPDDARIAFTRDERVYVVNTDGTGLALLAPDGPPAHSFAWAPDGKSLVVATGFEVSSLVSIPLDGGTPTPLTAPGAEESFPAYAPDGSKLAFARSGTGIVVRDLATGTEATVSSCDYPTNGCIEDVTPSWSPDGSALAFVRNLPSGSGTGSRFIIFSVTADGTTTTQLTGDDQSFTGPTWSG